MITRSWMAPSLLLAASCCVGQSIDTDDHPSRLRADGVVDGYVTASALRPYDGNLLRFGLFGYHTRRGEILSLDVWPVGAIGLGVVGARVRVLPFELALGTLFYDPEPPPYGRRPEEDELPPMETEEDLTPSEGEVSGSGP